MTNNLPSLETVQGLSAILAALSICALAFAFIMWITDELGFRAAMRALDFEDQRLRETNCLAIVQNGLYACIVCKGSGRWKCLTNGMLVKAGQWYPCSNCDATGITVDSTALHEPHMQTSAPTGGADFGSRPLCMQGCLEDNCIATNGPHESWMAHGCAASLPAVRTRARNNRTSIKQPFMQTASAGVEL